MKRMTILAAVAMVLLLLSVNASAQCPLHGHGQGNDAAPMGNQGACMGMGQAGMAGGMSGGPGCMSKGCCGRGGFGRGEAAGIGRLLQHADEIGLTKEQVTTLEGMRDQFQMGMVDLRANLSKARIELRSAMRQDPVDEHRVMSAIDMTERVRTEIQKQRFKQCQQVRGLLTDEQKEKLRKLDLCPGPNQGLGGAMMDDPQPDMGFGWFDEDN